ncbi:L,D-transpeptidase family protein [Streptomyces sp. NPDC057702]|uniref:L,D-transpeptidase family protein n=1 Tax=unclassified Streptomyces TaxID=2593676 RepID=UPI00367B93EB
MRRTGVLRVLGIAVLVTGLLAGCDGGAGGDARNPGEDTGPATSKRPPDSDRRGIPRVGEKLAARIPAATRQAVVVYGRSAHSAKSTVVLYTKDGDRWRRDRSWPAHNGRRGWTTHHHENDKRSPVGVFTLGDAGGVLPAPGTDLPYHHSAAFAAPRYWPKTHWHDFDYVVAIDYNRVRGTSPLDPTRPQGTRKGGSIWLHLDHGSGTSGCVSLPKTGMAYLLRTLDPAQHPVVVMGDRRQLAA